MEKNEQNLKSEEKQIFSMDVKRCEITLVFQKIICAFYGKTENILFSLNLHIFSHLIDLLAH